MTALAKTAGLGALLSGLLFQSGLVRLQYPDPSRYPVRGIDVSRHQGSIDWARVSRQRLAFAYIKASEGGDWVDPKFGENWRGAQEAGLAPGAYHFFTFCKGGAEQADQFLKVLSQVRGPMLPPAVDLEFGGNCAARPSPQDLARQLRVFTSRVERTLGARPVFYVTQSFWQRYHAAVPRGELWVRSVYLRPERAFPGQWKFWQFASRGRVPGIRGPIDLNVFHGSEDEWRRYLRGRLKLQPDDPFERSI